MQFKYINTFKANKMVEKERYITCTQRACYETRALWQDQLALKILREDLVVFAYLTIQHSSPSKWIPIDISNNTKPITC
jgi:hypothetical protein